MKGIPGRYISDSTQSRVIYPSSKQSWFILLLIFCKILHCVGIFLVFDLLKITDVVSLTFSLKLISGAFFLYIQKPFSSGSPLSQTQWFRIGQYSVLRVALSLLWLYGISLCGPFRSILVTQHYDVVIITAIGALFSGTQSPAVLRGMVLFVLAVISLLFLDHDESQLHPGNSHLSLGVESWFGLADHKLGVLFLCGLLPIQVGANMLGKRVGADVGSQRRLQSFVTIFEAILCLPWTLFMFFTKEMGEFYTVSNISPVLVASILGLVFVYYVESACSQRFEMLRIARIGSASMSVSALCIASFWEPLPWIRQPHTRHTIQLVQPAPIPSLTAPPQLVHNSEQTLHMQQELQRLHQQLHQQLQQMQAAAQAHSQREHELATTILAEQERVSELQRALRKEQRHALDLQSQLASHAVRAGLAVDETRLHQVSREAEQERARAQSLEQQLQQERAIIRQLKSAVLTERQRFQAAQRRDAELLQTLRLRLGEMAATTGDKLQQGSHRASTPVLPLSPVQLSSPPSSLEAALNVAPQSPVALQADAWASAEALAEVQRRLSDAQEETRGLRRRLNREQETSQQLRAELNLVRGHNDALDTQLTEVRANLAAQQAEHDRLNRRLRALEEAELRQQSRASAERTLAQERARQLETNVARLEAELAAERAVREDAVAESAQLQRDLEALRREADVAAASAATATAAAAAASVRIRSPPESPVEEPVAQRLKDMNASLDQQMRDHSKVALTLARLVEERRELQRKTNALAEQVTQLQTSEGKAHATVSRLTAEKASVMEECIALRLELARAKEELCRRHGEAADTEELENRVNHLFGRYLRAESYRKALAWQKKYLLIALGGYQQTEAYTLSRLAHVGATIPHRISEQSSGRRRQARFRSAAFVIVAIHRMKFLIQRWYRGRQIGGSTVLNHAYSESVFSGISAQGLRRGGSSAPSVSSWSVPASASVSLGAVPHSPPSHDHSSYNGRSLHRSEAARLPLWRSMDGLAGSLPRSVTPSRLAQFVERCDSLQQRLGLATAPLVTLATSPSRSPHRGEN